MIEFHNVDINCRVSDKTKLRSWIKNVISYEGKKLKSISIILCSDEYLLQMNKSYLNHNYYTDVLTFDLSENQNEIAGDIFISNDRIIENARKYKVSTQDELKRIILHGVLHLIGYIDSSREEKGKMKEKEDHYLARYY